jgi:hypothetical protein
VLASVPSSLRSVPPLTLCCRCCPCCPCSEDDDEESPKEAASDRPPAGDMDVDKSAADPRIEDPEAGAKVPAPAPKPRSANQELEIFSDDELEELDVNILKADVANLEGASARPSRLPRILGSRLTDPIALPMCLAERVLKSKPNMSVLQEFRRRQAEFDDRQADLDKVTAERDAGKTRYDDLRQTRHLYQVRAEPRGMESSVPETEALAADPVYCSSSRSVAWPSLSLSTASTRSRRASSSASCRPRSRGRTSQTCRAAKRRSVRSRSSLRCTSTRCVLLQLPLSPSFF